MLSTKPESGISTQDNGQHQYQRYLSHLGGPLHCRPRTTPVSCLSNLSRQRLSCRRLRWMILLPCTLCVKDIDLKFFPSLRIVSLALRARTSSQGLVETRELLHRNYVPSIRLRTSMQPHFQETSTAPPRLLSRYHPMIASTSAMIL